MVKVVWGWPAHNEETGKKFFFFHVQTNSGKVYAV
jgi:hypothetical protein